jgi:hypothetical protein
VDVPIELTCCTKADGLLGKYIALNDEGKVVSDGSACTRARGRAKRVPIDGVAELAACRT